MLRLVWTLLFLLPAACRQTQPDEEPAAPPVLVSTTPSDGAADLTGSNLTVVLTYDQNVKCPRSAQGGISAGTAVVESVHAYNKEVTVKLSGLQSGTSYTLTIPEGAVSGYRNNPAAAIRLTFSMKEVEPSVYPRNPAEILTDPAATPAAKALYAKLLGYYGTKTLSGAMGGTAWDTSYTDYIASLTGEYPAIVGFDYLFLDWPPDSWDTCPDYGDITPVRNAWTAGSIIQIGWHWAVPPAEGTTDLNTYSFYSKMVPAFKADAALTEGTWQNRIMKAQIAKLAGFLKLLQEAGIPVLFRPLHEAAGDYTYGAWFWWGTDGGPALIRLWQYLRDQLTETYGLHNLIWVFTVQTSDKGQLADVGKLREWYPGDNYVDIVGADLYVPKNSTQAGAFQLVNASVYGRKMVVLSEFGNLLDIDGFFAADAPWGYFMNWYNFENGQPVLYARNADGGYIWNNTATDWKNALSNIHTLNRDDLK